MMAFWKAVLRLLQGSTLLSFVQVWYEFCLMKSNWSSLVKTRKRCYQTMKHFNSTSRCRYKLFTEIKLNFSHQTIGQNVTTPVAKVIIYQICPGIILPISLAVQNHQFTSQNVHNISPTLEIQRVWQRGQQDYSMFIAVP